jgi:hypothetical protein
MRGKAYRVYALDGDGLVVRTRVVEARSDHEAIALAEQTGWARWQVWTGKRLIGDSTTRTDPAPPGD